MFSRKEKKRPTPSTMEMSSGDGRDCALRDRSTPKANTGRSRARRVVHWRQSAMRILRKFREPHESDKSLQPVAIDKDMGEKPVFDGCALRRTEMIHRSLTNQNLERTACLPAAICGSGELSVVGVSSEGTAFPPNSDGVTRPTGASGPQPFSIQTRTFFIASDITPYRQQRYKSKCIITAPLSHYRLKVKHVYHHLDHLPVNCRKTIYRFKSLA